jgi:ATP-dependent helicase Lhr and Lhr-like helicase
MQAISTTDQLAPALDWFAARGWQPFAFQREVWEAYLHGESGLIHAATGTGKTYAAWLGPLLEWIADCRLQIAEPVVAKKQSTIGLRVLWITPLRALAADTAAALRAPIDDLGLPWTLETRTGDTSATVKARQRKRLPTALITTPESLSLLLSQPEAAALFADLRAVIVDEWHELLASKRGVQTELALARLRRWRPDLRTWGLSATLGNLDVALQALVGMASATDNTEGTEIPIHQEHSVHSVSSVALHTQARLVRGLVPKMLQVESLIPPQLDRFPWAGHLGLSMVEPVAEVVSQSQSTLIFTNTRGQSEIWYQALLDARPEWAGEIALHHGSLDRGTREWVEQALRDGRLRCVVSTSSLDLGVDFSPVDTVIQVGSPKGVARLMQRAGRSGHRPGSASRVVCVPTHALELIEIAAVRDAIQSGQIEARPPIVAPLDVLVQHLVTVALGGGFRADELLAEVRSTYAYRDLSDAEWHWALDFATRGGSALQNYPEYARIVEQDGRYLVTNTTIARRHRMAIGTITSDATLKVQYLRGPTIGSIEESFVARLRPGERFLFGGKTLEFVRLRDLTAWVRRAADRTQAVPRWSGSRMALSAELAGAIRQRLEAARDGELEGPEMRAVAPILRVQAKWSRIPARDELLIERAKTREGYHLFVYPFEGRLANEGLAALLAYRLARLQPISFAIAVNDYGFELLAPEPLPPADFAAMLSPIGLADDIMASLNATEMARRQFREIARVAGLVIQGYPGEKSLRQVQASSGLIYDVFMQHDPANLLLSQARREVLERQLERGRMARALERIAAGHISVVDVPRITPLAFPLLIDHLREAVSSEKLADRVRKMQLVLEKAAGA